MQLGLHRLPKVLSRAVTDESTKKAEPVMQQKKENVMKHTSLQTRPRPKLNVPKGNYAQGGLAALL
jgi:hypothetical protein